MSKRPFITRICIPVICISPLFILAFYMAWKESASHNKVIDLALHGNQYAIALLREYDKPWKLDEKLLQAALEGNRSALRALKVDSVND